MALLMVGGVSGCGGKGTSASPLTTASSHRAATAMTTFAAWRKKPCSAFTTDELADALHGEYAKLHVASAGKPSADGNKCSYPVRGPFNTGDLAFVDLGDAGDTNVSSSLKVCEESARTKRDASRLVTIGDEGCVDQMSYAYFRSGTHFFAVLTMLAAPDIGTSDERFQSLTAAAGRYLLTRLDLS